MSQRGSYLIDKSITTSLLCFCTLTNVGDGGGSNYESVAGDFKQRA